jgi:uncharacterized protein with HEPN domain
MSKSEKKALPVYEQNPNLHLKKLREFRAEVKRHYTGEDQEILLAGTDAKIEEIEKTIANEAKYSE